MRNPRPRLPNLNTLYLGSSGSGKSTALKENRAIPSRGAPVLLWDPNEDHHAIRRYSNIRHWVQAVQKCDEVWRRQGKGYRVAYSGVNDLTAYLVWCKVAAAVLNGDWLTYMIVEEMADVSPHAGTAPPPAKKLLNQCRKYGGVFHGTSQKPQEISKTYYENCDLRFIGRVRSVSQKKKMAEELGLTVQEFDSLENIDGVQVELWKDTGKTVERWRHEF